MAMSVVYTTMNGRIIRQNKGGVVHNFVSDPLGSVVMVRDTSGNTVYEAEYDPYGNVQSETGTNPSSLGYVGTLGYIKDSATSMYVRARYLLNNLGRWLTKDPLWPSEPGYVYAGAAPSMWGDPSGKMGPISLVMPYLEPSDPPRINHGRPGMIIRVVDACTRSPFCVSCARAVAEKAIKKANAWCKAEFGFPDGRNDGTICNAYQHCLGQCLAARECGAYCASLAGDANELRGRNPGDHLCMDLYNNAIGLNVGANRFVDCESGCNDEISKGNCQVVRPLNPSSSKRPNKCKISCMLKA
jgi:RHS repeat-associated protein